MPPSIVVALEEGKQIAFFNLAWISTPRDSPNAARFAGDFLMLRKISFCPSAC
jgi:hypothetical protein